jgi:hypothetical protein
MKIHDIISETPVQEGAVDLLKLAGRGLGAGAKWVAQRGPKKDLINLIAGNTNMIKNTLKGVPPTVKQIETIYGPQAAEIFAKDPNFMRRALLAYQKSIAPATGPATKTGTQTAQQIAQQAGSSAPAVTSGINKIKLAGIVAKVVSAYGLVDMVMTFNTAIDYADSQLKKGVDNGGWSQEQYDAFVAHKKATLVAQIAASTVVFSTLKTLGGWNSLGLMLKTRRSPYAIKIGETMSTMSSAARAAVIIALGRPEARRMFSDMFAGGIVDEIGSATYNGIANLFKAAKEQTLGAPDKADDATADATAADDKEATTTTPSTTNGSSTSGAPAEYKGNPLFKNVR